MNCTWPFAKFFASAVAGVMLTLFSWWLLPQLIKMVAADISRKVVEQSALRGMGTSTFNSLWMGFARSGLSRTNLAPTIKSVSFNGKAS
jgi:hypothetical protein